MLVQRFLDFNQLWAVSGESQNVVWMRRSVLATEHAMAAPRRVVDVSIGRKELAQLRSIARSRSEAAGRVERARMLLAYREDPSFFSVGRALGVHHQTVQRCLERAQTLGVLAALDDAPRPGRAPEITVEARGEILELKNTINAMVDRVRAFASDRTSVG